MMFWNSRKLQFHIKSVSPSKAESDWIQVFPIRFSKNRFTAASSNIPT